MLKMTVGCDLSDQKWQQWLTAGKKVTANKNLILWNQKETFVEYLKASLNQG